MQKRSTSLFIVLLLLPAIIVSTLNSCSKNDTAEETPPVSLHADKNQYAPFEIVSITPAGNIFTAPSFTATINTVEVVMDVQGNTASFVLPNVANGHYQVIFTLNDKNYTVPVTVSSLSNVAVADQYFNEIKAGIDQNISDLNAQIAQLEQQANHANEFLALKNDVTKYTDLRNKYVTAYNGLSAGEKQDFAQCMAANKASIDEYNKLTTTLHTSTASLREQAVKDHEAEVEVSKAAFVSSVVFTVAHIPAMITTAKLMANPNPWVSGGAVVAFGLIFTSYIYNLDETITASKHLTDKSIRPFEFITQTAQTVYYSGVETLSDIQAKYRSLVNDDSNNGSNGSTIKTIVGKYNDFRDKYNSFVNELPALFKPSYIMAALRNTYNSTTRAIHNKYISISNISNSKVTLQKIDQPDGSIKLKATTTATTDQTFTYDITYTNSQFTTGLKRTVNAKVSPAGCSPDSIIGTWLVESYSHDSGSPTGYSPYQYTFIMKAYANGQLTFQATTESTVTNSTYTFSNCGFSINFFGCGHYIKMVENVSSYTVSGCGGFHHHVYTKQ